MLHLIESDSQVGGHLLFFLLLINNRLGAPIDSLLLLLRHWKKMKKMKQTMKTEWQEVKFSPSGWDERLVSSSFG